MPLEADLELAKFLTVRGLISPDQITLGFLFATTRPDGKKLSLADGLVAKGFLSQDLADGVQSVRANATALPAEPKDLEGRLLLEGKLSPRDLGRVKRIRGEVRKVLPDSVPSIGQVILHTEMMDLGALRVYYDTEAEPSPPLELRPQPSPSSSPPIAMVEAQPIQVPLAKPGPADSASLRRRTADVPIPAPATPKLRVPDRPASSSPGALGDEPTPVKSEEPTPVKRGMSGLLPAFDGPVVSMPPEEPSAEELGLCGICKLTLLADIPRKTCETCRRQYHLACWNPRTGCPQALCKQLRSTLDYRVIRSGPSAAILWLKHYAKLLIGSAVLLLFLIWAVALVRHDAGWYYLRSKEAREGATSTQQFQRMTDPRHGIEVDDSPDGKAAGILLKERVNRQIEYLHQALALDPRMVPAWFDLGTAGMEIGDDTTAREGFDGVIRLDEKNGLARIAMGILSERSRNYPDAERLYREAVALAPDTVDGWRRLAWLLDERRPEARAEAVECYGRVLALEPKDEETQIRKAIAEVRLTRPEAALPVLEAMQAKHPERYDIVLAVAMADRDLGRWPDAAQRAEEAAALKLDEVDARLVWADALAHEGKHAQAIAVLEPVATEGQKNGEVFQRRAESQAALWDVDAALASARHAVELEPSPASRMAQARVLARAGRSAEAAEVARALGREAPKTAGLDLLLSALLLEIGDAEGAGQALARAPQGPNRDLLEVRGLRVTHALDAAEERVRALLGKPGSSGALRVEAGLIELERGFPSQALESLQGAQDAQEPEAFAAQARVYRRMGETARAACAYADFLRQVPYGARADEARSFLAELDPGATPRSLDFLSAALREHARLCAPPPSFRRRLDQIAGLLAELVVLMRIPSRADARTEQELDALRVLADAYTRPSAAPIGVTTEKEAQEREGDLRRALAQCVQVLSAGLETMGTLAERDGLQAPGAERERAVVADYSARITSDNDDARRAGVAIEGWNAFLGIRAFRHAHQEPLVARLAEIDQRRAAEAGLARGTFTRLAAGLCAFAEGGIGFVETLNDRPLAARAAARCRMRLAHDIADARDALDQLRAAAQAACETFQVLDLLAGGGWAGGASR